MDYYDEWRIDLLPEEELNIIYADWESWFASELEHLTIPICLVCGNQLQILNIPLQCDPTGVYHVCGVC